MKRLVRRSTAVFVLALSLAAIAQAAPSPRRSAPAAPERASLLAAAWTWIARLALPAPAPRLTAITEKAGCEIDPNGRMNCSPAPAVQTDEGCEMDPNGVR